MKPTLPRLRKEFWDVNRRLLRVDSTGRIHFTKEGHSEYLPLFSRHGYVLENVRTLADFRRVMQDLTTLQQEKNNDDLLRRVPSRGTLQGERTLLLAEGLGVGPPTTSKSAPATHKGGVVSLRDWRTRGVK